VLQSSSIVLGDGVVRLVTGAALLLCGLFGATFAYAIALLSEQFDAIGSTTPTEAVEPAAWKVRLTRLTGVAIALVGGWRVVTGATSLL